MPVWPKSILQFGANLLTARTAVRLRSRGRATRLQQSAFRGLVRHLASTSYWREAGIAAGMSYEQFRRQVAPRAHAALAPAIARMQQGEAGVLWPGRCAFFALTAGTSTGQPRVIPVTPPMLRHFRDAGQEALLFYTAQSGHAGVFRGRHLVLAGSDTLQEIATGGHRAFVGQWPAVAALTRSRWVRADGYEPRPDIAALADWREKLEAVVATVATSDISLLAGMPPWVLAAAAALLSAQAAAGHPLDNLQALWPNLECYVHGGTPLGPYQPELRAALGPTVNFHEVYAAAEAIIAAQDTPVPGALRLIAGRGVFFEFVPLAAFDERRVEAAGERALPLADVQPGVDYVVLVTTPAGLARYVLGDIVRFTSVEPPRLTYTGRVGEQL